METSGLDGDEDVKRLVVDCLTHGTATRLRAYYPFRRRVDTLCDSMGINREPHTRSNLSDVVIMADKEFVWRKKKVTRSMLESWEYFRTIEPFESD